MTFFTCNLFFEVYFGVTYSLLRSSTWSFFLHLCFDNKSDQINSYFMSNQCDYRQLECSFHDCIRIKTCYQVITIMTIWNFPVHTKPISLGTSSRVLLCKGITPMISKSFQKLLFTNAPSNPKSEFMTSCERGPLGGHN